MDPKHLALLLPFLAQATLASCPTLAGHPGNSCIATEQGWFYARDRAEAATFAEDIAANAAAFERFFGIRPPRLAVLLADEGETLDDAGKRTLMEAGAEVAIPWPTDAAHAAMVGEGLRKSGLAESAIARHPLLNGVMRRPVTRHELGHVMFTRAFFPGAEPVRGHSSGNLPDWLNEMAAMLLEPEAAASHRRRLLRELLGDPGRRASILPLNAYFRSENPAKPPAGQAVATKGVSLVFRAGNDGKAQQEARSAWYAQTQAFADFLLAESGDPGIFGDLARSLSQGRDVGDWLDSTPHAGRLPRDLGGLQARWENWLQRSRPL